MDASSRVTFASLCKALKELSPALQQRQVNELQVSQQRVVCIHCCFPSSLLCILVFSMCPILLTFRWTLFPESNPFLNITNYGLNSALFCSCRLLRRKSFTTLYLKRISKVVLRKKRNSLYASSKICICFDFSIFIYLFLISHLGRRSAST
jgi:hypothetical protein